MYLYFKKKILFNILKIFDIFFMLSALVISLSLWGVHQDDDLSIWELLYIKTKVHKYCTFADFHTDMASNFPIPGAL